MINTLEAAKVCIMNVHVARSVKSTVLYTRLSVLAMVLIVGSVRCKARILKAWYGRAAPENASVADVYREYSSRGLDRTKAKL